MDMIMFDVTDVAGVSVRDEVVVLGAQDGPLGRAAITADEIAEVAKTALTTEGMKDEMVAMYKGMGEAADDLSAAAAKKDEAGAMGAMKKIAASCTECHAKFKK